MYIDENGYKLFTLNEIKHAYEVELQKLLGADFCIKPDSTADNLITAFALHELMPTEKHEEICSPLLSFRFLSIQLDIVKNQYLS